MPKVINTLKQQKTELFKRLERGPSYSFGAIDLHGADAKKVEEELRKQYKLWFESWNEVLLTKVLLPKE